MSQSKRLAIENDSIRHRKAIAVQGESPNQKGNAPPFPLWNPKLCAKPPTMPMPIYRLSQEGLPFLYVSSTSLLQCLFSQNPSSQTNPQQSIKIVRQMTFREARVARAIRWETSHPFLSFCRLPCSDRRSWDGRALCDVVEMFARLPNDVVKS